MTGVSVWRRLACGAACVAAGVLAGAAWSGDDPSRPGPVERARPARPAAETYAPEAVPEPAPERDEAAEARDWAPLVRAFERTRGADSRVVDHFATQTPGERGFLVERLPGGFREVVFVRDGVLVPEVRSALVHAWYTSTPAAFAAVTAQDYLPGREVVVESVAVRGPGELAAEILNRTDGTRHRLGVHAFKPSRWEPRDGG